MYSALERAYASAFKDLSALECRIKALTAEEYLIPSVRMTSAFAIAGAPVWMFRFDHGEVVFGEPRAAHVSDLPFWWNNLPCIAAPNPSVAAPLAEAMHSALAQFIHGEQPCVAGSHWPIYDTVHRSVLAWSEQPFFTASPAQSDLELWGDLRMWPSSAPGHLAARG